jgi:hypothetical protein
MSVKNLSVTYLLKAKRSPRSETLCWSLSNVQLVQSGVLAAESNTINEKRTKTLAKSIVEISFIRPSPGASKGLGPRDDVSLR